MWDREAGRRRDTTSQDLERWRASLQSIGDVGAFQAIQRNFITPDGSVVLAAVAEISSTAFRIARVPPLLGRVITDSDAAAGAAPVVVIGYDIWQQRFAGAHDVIGRELRLGKEVHTVIGVMPVGFQFPSNFRCWVPLQPRGDGIVRNTGSEGVVFGRLEPGVTLERAQAEVPALGILPPIDARPNPNATGPLVVPCWHEGQVNGRPSWPRGLDRAGTRGTSSGRGGFRHRARPSDRRNAEEARSKTVNALDTLVNGAIRVGSAS